MPIHRAEDSVRLRAAFPPPRLPWQFHFLVFPRFFPLVAFASNSTGRAVLGTGGEEIYFYCVYCERESANRYYRIRGGATAKGIISNIRNDLFFFYFHEDNTAERTSNDGLSMEKCAGTLDAVDHLFTRMSKNVFAPRIVR